MKPSKHMHTSLTLLHIGYEMFIMYVIIRLIQDF